MCMEYLPRVEREVEDWVSSSMCQPVRDGGLPSAIFKALIRNIDIDAPVINLIVQHQRL